MALARLDSDAAWSLLTTALNSRHGGVGGWAPAPPPPLGRTRFPALRQILPPAPAAGAVPAGLRECGAARLEAMLGQVDTLRARWHGGGDTS